MSIAINAKQCVGCGKCSMVCPGSLIHMNADGKAFIKYPKDCWGCTSCLKECAVHAIRFYLGADMGGMGSLVHTEKEGDVLRWIIVTPTEKPVRSVSIPNSRTNIEEETLCTNCHILTNWKQRQSTLSEKLRQNAKSR